MTGIDEAKIVRSLLFPAQRRDTYDGRIISVGEQKDAACFLTTPELDIYCIDEMPAEAIRKALCVIAEAQIPLRLSNSNETRDAVSNSASEAKTVSTASTFSTSFTRDEVSRLDSVEVSDLETDEENEFPVTRTPPDALFIVQGKEFPCHSRILSKEAPPLLDILTRDGVLERKTKKRRTPPSRCQPEGEDRTQAWSSPSGITVARLPKDVNSDYFEMLMGFLYTNEIRIKLPVEYNEDDEEDDPWLADNEDIFDDDNCEDIGDSLDCILSAQNEEAKPTITPMKFLQESFIQADRFGCSSLKDAIENKLYDEFLFSFTAKELFSWADQNNCAFLKEKAMNKLSASSSDV